MLTRRDLLSRASVAALALGLPEQSDAWVIHGSGVTSTNTNRVTINASLGFLNLAKNFYFNIDPANASSDGYPVVAPTSGWNANIAMPLGYYGNFVWKFSGQGSIQIAAQSILVSSTSATTTIVELHGATSGSVSGNITISGQTNPRVVFQFGWNIQSIGPGASNGAGGNLIRVTVPTGNFDQGGATGTQVNISGANSNTGVNGITWTVNRVDPQTFDLQGSTYTNSQATAAGTAIYIANNITLYMYTSGPGTFSGMSNLVWCKTGDESAITSGLIVDTQLINQLIDLKPGWLRFMDAAGVQSNFEGDFSQRMPVTYLTYNPTRYPQGYWSGAISWNSGDAYTVADPSVSTWGGSSYNDNAIVQGTIDLENVGPNPTLNVGGHGAKPIINFNVSPIIFKLWGSLPSANQSIVFQFSAPSWTLPPLNGGSPYTFTYTTSAGATFTGASSGTTTLTVTGLGAGQTLYPGNIINGNINYFPSGTKIVSQSSGPTGGNGTYITSVATSIPTQTVTVNNDTASFTGTGSLYANLVAAMSADATLSATGIQFGYSGPDTLHSFPSMYMRTPMAGALTLTYVSGPTGFGCTVGRLDPLAFSSYSDQNYPNTLRITLSGTIVTGDVLNLTFTRSDLSGGSHVVSYTTNTTTNGPGGVPDSSLQNLVVNLNAQINADATLAAAGMISIDSSEPANTFDIFQARTGTTPNNGNVYDSWTGGGLTLSFTKVSGTGTESAAFRTSGLKATFIYNSLLGGWLYRPGGGATQSTPLEVIVEMCNRVGANCWYNWGTSKGPFITAATNFFATNLNAGLKFGTEVGNELWNFGANPFGQFSAFGAALNFTSPGDNAVYSYGALRTIQYAALSRAAWAAAGRAASDHYILQPSAYFDININGNFDHSQLKGASLVLSNSVYASYGALNQTGTAVSDYSVAGSRPVDVTNAIGLAPYWNSPWLSTAASHINGTVAQNAPWLQASLDFTNGNTSTAFTSMENQFNGTTIRTAGSSEGGTLGSGAQIGTGVNFNSIFTLNEALAAQYDSTRPSGMSPLGILHYEGGPQWGMGADGINGVNSVNANDISALANQMTNGSSNLGWDVRAYDASGSTNVNTAATNVATQAITMEQAWKFDIDRNGNPANTNTYKNLIKTYYYQALVGISGPHREVHPAQYGYGGPSQWGYFPGSYTGANPYQNYNATKEFDQ